MKDLNGDEICCAMCGGRNVEPVPVEGQDDGHARFKFSLTHRRDGSAVKNPILGVIELVWCGDCKKNFVVLDDLDGRPEQWAKLPQWEKEM